jgi:hypothetical protein
MKLLRWLRGLVLAVNGHKLEIGIFLTALGQAAEQVVPHIGPSLAAVGVNAETSAHVVQMVGAAMAAVGAFHRFLKGAMFSKLAGALRNLPPAPPVVGVLILLALLPVVATADDAEITPTPPAPLVEVESFAGPLTLVRPGKDRVPVVVARVQATAHLPGAFRLAARVETSAQGEGEETYTSMEAYGTLSRRVLGPASLVGIFGGSWPVKGETTPAGYRQTLAGGLQVGNRDAFVLGAIGRHMPLGAKLAVGGSLQVPTSIGRSYAVVDAVRVIDGELCPGKALDQGCVLSPTWEIKAGILVKVLK